MPDGGPAEAAEPAAVPIAYAATRGPATARPSLPTTVPVIAPRDGNEERRSDVARNSARTRVSVEDVITSCLTSGERRKRGGQWDRRTPDSPLLSSVRPCHRQLSVIPSRQSRGAAEDSEESPADGACVRLRAGDSSPRCAPAALRRLRMTLGTAQHHDLHLAPLPDRRGGHPAADPPPDPEHLPHVCPDDGRAGAHRRPPRMVEPHDPSPRFPPSS